MRQLSFEIQRSAEMTGNKRISETSVAWIVSDQYVPGQYIGKINILDGSEIYACFQFRDARDGACIWVTWTGEFV